MLMPGIDIRCNFFLYLTIDVVVFAIVLSRLYNSPRIRPVTPLQDSDVSTEIFPYTEFFKVDYLKMEQIFKVFVYPDESENAGSHELREPTGKYASEGYFYKNIRESRFLTHDPNHAHLFFVPLPCQTLQFRGRSHDDMAMILQDYVESLILKYPYWNRTSGADHFFVTCRDIGLIATLPLLKNSIRVGCLPSHGAKIDPPKDVSLPIIAQPFLLPAAGYGTKNRTTLAFWAGHRNSDVRNKLVNLWGNDTSFDIQSRVDSKSKGHVLYLEKFRNSKFCICPWGPQVWTARIAESIHYGCVPLILADNHYLPFTEAIDWKIFSLVVEENDVGNLKNVLEGISSIEYSNLHMNTIKVQKHFQWNSPPVSLDAFHMIMYELWWRHNESGIAASEPKACSLNTPLRSSAFEQDDSLAC